MDRLHWTEQMETLDSQRRQCLHNAQDAELKLQQKLSQPDRDEIRSDWRYWRARTEYFASRFWEEYRKREEDLHKNGAHALLKK